ncbi:MAG: metabolite traffic protein EboE [Planctomycetota bacterium]
MRFVRPGEERALRLGYCLNLHAAESVADVRAALETFSAPLRDRLLEGGDTRFGVGMYLASGAARELAADAGATADLRAFLDEHRFDPFTFNAFPFGGFQEDGLKERVYEPTWLTPERVAFTVDVARVAAALASGRSEDDAHVSISTHPGAYGADVRDRSTLRRCAEGFGRAVGELARIEDETGVRIVLSLESEPDASARNARALAESLVFTRLVASRVLQDEFGRDVEASGRLAARHLGTCLDCCHSAVEFEDAAEALTLASHEGPLGKVQFSSAIRLASPGEREDARVRLLAMDEPRFLHQVTARSGGEFVHLPDLPALRAAVAAGDATWLGAEEWRCHFHVPVDRADVGVLGTTRDHADAILDGLLAAPADWSTPELHVEIETYTWSVLDEEVDVVDGLEAEYRHVLGRLAAGGWERAEGA